jgi:putative FmdB family regulatory protein
MLIHLYQCLKCNDEFEMTRLLDDTGDIECPHCGSGSVKRMASIAASCSGVLKSSSGNPPGQNA